MMVATGWSIKKNEKSEIISSILPSLKSLAFSNDDDSLVLDLGTPILWLVPNLEVLHCHDCTVRRQRAIPRLPFLQDTGLEQPRPVAESCRTGSYKHDSAKRFFPKPCNGGGDETIQGWHLPKRRRDGGLGSRPRRGPRRLVSLDPDVKRAVVFGSWNGVAPSAPSPPRPRHATRLPGSRGSAGPGGLKSLNRTGMRQGSFRLV
ncbi:hypothetical protein BT67DRAFT_95138 [Trichocladium antarcticum]|uniref:Uncharacterized protein n=1 Tax=Trichocladium antarcticum TaxID=1450529 RepID=A0AAN6ZGX0_9PEZI|nr:hypothetical protein BT67DRAFT_95138 [Trichocladium antarcticum]